MTKPFYFLLILLVFPAGGLDAAEYALNGDVAGQIEHYTIQKGDTYAGIARRFDLGVAELLAANPGANRKYPIAGKSLLLPTMHVLPPVAHQGIVLNLPELRLFYFTSAGTVMTFPVSIGREGWLTPTGRTSIIRKRKDPVWIPPESIREENPDLPDQVPPGPENPLGHYALSLGIPGYAIHGTNRPSSIGKRISHGCIRLYPDDIEALFYAVGVGTPVTIIDLPYKLGWRDGTLFLELPSALSQNQFSKSDIYAAVRQAALDAAIDWQAVDSAIDHPTELPVAVAKRI